MNMLLAADLLIVARDARLLADFLKRGMHTGGGHSVILSRIICREAAAAMTLFGKEINGEEAVELDLAWESLDDAAIEDRARELAARVAADPELARVAVGNFRKEVVNSAIPWDVAMQSERPAQMWSMRRCAGCAQRPAAGMLGRLSPPEKAGQHVFLCQSISRL